MGVARVPEYLKPTRVVKQRAIATTRLSGVTGDSGRRQISLVSGRPILRTGDRACYWPKRRQGINNLVLAGVGVGEGNKSDETE